MLDPSSAVDRHPEITGRIHRQTVRRSDVWWHLDQHLPSGDRALVRIKSESVDDTWSGVHQIHRSIVWTPAKSVRDRQSVEHQLGLATAIEPVKGPSTRSLIISKSARPEAALGIAGGIVHPGPVRRDVGNSSYGAIWTQVAEPLICC